MPPGDRQTEKNMSRSKMSISSHIEIKMIRRSQVKLLAVGRGNMFSVEDFI